MSNIDNLVVEHLKKIQAEQSAARDRDAEILRQLSTIETGIARIVPRSIDKLRQAD